MEISPGSLWEDEARGGVRGTSPDPKMRSIGGGLDYWLAYGGSSGVAGEAFSSDLHYSGIIEGLSRLCNIRVSSLLLSTPSLGR